LAPAPRLGDLPQKIQDLPAFDCLDARRLPEVHADGDPCLNGKIVRLSARYGQKQAKRHEAQAPVATLRRTAS
jgi:hypothetical protein